MADRGLAPAQELVNALMGRDQPPADPLFSALAEWGSPALARGQPNWFGRNVLGTVGKVSEAMPPGAFDAMSVVMPGTRVKAYHGTTADLTKGISPMARDNLDATAPPAISLAPTGERANAFAQNGVGGYPSGSAVHVRDLDLSGFKEIDWPSFKAKYTGVPEGQLGLNRRGKDTFDRWDPYTWKALLEELQKDGHPGAVVNGMADASGTGPQYVTFDRERLK